MGMAKEFVEDFIQCITSYNWPQIIVTSGFYTFLVVVVVVFSPILVICGMNEG
jgi:hypothetical protein